MLRLITLFALGLLAVTNSQADVYRYIDKNGQVQYTDKPELLPAELLAKLKSQRTDNSAIADRVAADLKARDTAAKIEETATKAKADKQKAIEATAADKADRCIQARGRYESLTNSSRVYSVDTKGERVYMDDKQIEQSRTAAKQQMDTWCN
jgi:hypothetical protein